MSWDASPSLCGRSRRHYIRGQKWLTRRLPTPGPRKVLTRNQEPASVQSRQQTNQHPQRAICSYHLSSEHSIQTRQQISHCRGHYVKMLLEELGELGGGCGASSGIRSKEEQREEPRWICLLLPSQLAANPPYQAPWPSTLTRWKCLQESGTRPEFNQLFLGSLLIFPENVFKLFC